MKQGKRKTKKQWDPRNMIKAIKAVRSQQMGLLEHKKKCSVHFGLLSEIFLQKLNCFLAKM